MPARASASSGQTMGPYAHERRPEHEATEDAQAPADVRDKDNEHDQPRLPPPPKVFTAIGAAASVMRVIDRRSQIHDKNEHDREDHPQHERDVRAPPTEARDER